MIRDDKFSKMEPEILRQLGELYSKKLVIIKQIFNGDLSDIFKFSEQDPTKELNLFH